MKVLATVPLTAPPAAFPSGFDILCHESDWSALMARCLPGLPFQITEVLARLVLALRLLGRRHRYDAIVTGRYGEYFAILQSLLPFGRRPHLLLDVEWHVIHSASWRHRLNRWMHVRMTRGATRIQVFCQIEAQNYARHFHVPLHHFVFIPYEPPPPPTVPPAPGDYLLTSGHHQRDYPTLFAAIAGLPIELRVVADPAFFAHQQVPPNVHILGTLTANEYFSQLAGARLLVLALDGRILRRSGVITYATAMRAGKCCVVNDPAGAASYIEHGRTGFLVPNADPAALRLQIQELLANPALVARVAAAAAGYAPVPPYATAIRNLVRELVPAP